MDEIYSNATNSEISGNLIIKESDKCVSFIS